MKTLLFIDDDEYTLEHWGRLIERFGFKVLRAATGEEGIEIYQKEKPNMVLLDLLLPNMDGEEVLRKIRMFDPQAKIYIISGDTVAMAAVQARDAGANGYLTKPLILDDVEKILTGE